jgi:hypothetical protein
MIIPDEEDDFAMGFTGTQEGMTPAQIATLYTMLRNLSPEEFHHGDCIGADAQAHAEARATKSPPHIACHPPINASKRAYCECDEYYEEAEYLQRNRNIVDSCFLLVAAPKEFDEQRRSGTWSTVRYAKKIGRQFVIILPDGTTTETL